MQWDHCCLISSRKLWWSGVAGKLFPCIQVSRATKQCAIKSPGKNVKNVPIVVQCFHFVTHFQCVNLHCGTFVYILDLNMFCYIAGGL